ncbi:hypothetical protein LV779_37000 [Streptomyces thinghirensis]|nr:hypothetical protein [Streptomyces thinghirensis]
MTEAYVQQGPGSTGDEALLVDILRGSTTSPPPSTSRHDPLRELWEWGSAALYDHRRPPRLPRHRLGTAAACAAVDHFIPDAMLGGLLRHFHRRQRVDSCCPLPARFSGPAPPDRPRS